MPTYRPSITHNSLYAHSFVARVYHSPNWSEVQTYFQWILTPIKNILYNTSFSLDWSIFHAINRSDYTRSVHLSHETCLLLRFPYLRDFNLRPDRIFVHICMHAHSHPTLLVTFVVLVCLLFVSCSSIEYYLTWFWFVLIFWVTMSHSTCARDTCVINFGLILYK